MNEWNTLLAEWGYAALDLLIQPFYYMAVLFMFLYYLRQTAAERRLIHVKLHSPGAELWRSLWSGLLAGLGVSAAGAALGISLSPAGVAAIWIVSLLLLLLRVRAFCFAYAAGTLGVLQFVLSFFPDARLPGWGGELLQAVRDLDIPALVVLAGLLHLAEALLARLQGPSLATPLYLEGKRGRTVGGYRLDAFWPVPLFLLIPAGSAAGELPWPTLLGGGLGLVSLPVVIGYSDWTTGRLPRVKAARVFGRLLLYAAALVVLGLGAAWWSPLTLPAALAALLLHEGLVWLGAREERRSSPFFVDPPHGLKIMAVLPASPADELGVQPGEILVRVNGMPVTGRAQLHEALRLNPAYCKLEVLNAAGESKYLQRPIYDGDHHQLGVILAPLPDEDVTVPEKAPSLPAVVALRTGARRRGRTEAEPAAQEHGSAEA
ncbi:PDZ domain-containing protein [Paenibacillus glufosinatiresistens]|uniref:PDZ domain-containing protein n=1 Tax=Paenibacillus glufosinatiresistens TaxID=3070657 RepID=UPI00286E3D36|nr:PDZ domain-containing protein [Paenibacillus sp. YX.27]